MTETGRQYTSVCPLLPCNLFKSTRTLAVLKKRDVESHRANYSKMSALPGFNQTYTITPSEKCLRSCLSDRKLKETCVSSVSQPCWTPSFASPLTSWPLLTPGPHIFHQWVIILRLRWGMGGVEVSRLQINTAETSVMEWSRVRCHGKGMCVEKKKKKCNITRRRKRLQIKSWNLQFFGLCNSGYFYFSLSLSFFVQWHKSCIEWWQLIAFPCLLPCAWACLRVCVCRSKACACRVILLHEYF